MTGPDLPGRPRSAELQHLLDESADPPTDSVGSAPAPAEPAEPAEPGPDTATTPDTASDTATRPIVVAAVSRPAQPEQVARLAFERQTMAARTAPAAQPSRGGRLWLAGGAAAAVVAVVVVTAVRFSGADPAQPAPGPVVSVLDTARSTPAASDPGLPSGAAARSAPPAPAGRSVAPVPTAFPTDTATAGSDPSPVPPGATPTPTSAPAPAVDPSLLPDGPSVLRPGDENPGTVITGTSRLTGWVPLTGASGSADGGVSAPAG